MFIIFHQIPLSVGVLGALVSMSILPAREGTQDFFCLFGALFEDELTVTNHPKSRSLQSALLLVVSRRINLTLSTGIKDSEPAASSGKVKR